MQAGNAGAPGTDRTAPRHRGRSRCAVRSGRAVVPALPLPAVAPPAADCASTRASVPDLRSLLLPFPRPSRTEGRVAKTARPKAESKQALTTDVLVGENRKAR